MAQMKRLQWRLKWLVSGLLMTICAFGVLAALVFK
jgi:predicted outer membrane lipoprotein